MKKKIIRRNNNNNYNNYSPLVVHQAILPSTHTFLIGVSTLYLDCGAPQYFSCYLPLAFLKGCCPFSSLAVIFLHLDPVIWDPSAPSKRTVSSSSTSSQSCWRGWGKTWWYRNKSKKLSFLFMYCWPRYHHGIFWINSIGLQRLLVLREEYCYMQVHLSRNYIPAVISSSNYTSLPFTAATFFTTCLTAVLQPSEYSIFHGGNTPIWLGIPW